MELGVVTFADLGGLGPEQRMRNLLEEAEHRGPPARARRARAADGRARRRLTAADARTR